MPRISSDQAGGVNRCAFLDAIAYSEIGPALLAVSDDGYNVMVGSTSQQPYLFDGYATHPNVYSARFNSTAAGRYQLLYRYWVAYKALLSLADFSPESQDRIALKQIKESNALPLIDAGKFVEAIAAVAHLWASLPGSPYGQHTQSMADLQTAYTNAGGSLC